ncbi:MAG: hypothetical protein HN352_03985 [Bacteroidetes bacterium]|jgi:hypothetical protein|nr:hypothetical protein [Bacteroidota bacterium]MBT3751552.1 hypothetical protein [Bacteroidota bacterium]MBT4402223.1 hypothetical protein [Bacteroidota bacterium]MBT4411335.1 hypothetical protein [Bacteroidota bacterium]MBT5427432.1 hypothetical protein [Bacteroidota bacterium]
MAAKSKQNTSIRFIILTLAVIFVIWSVYQERIAKTQLGVVEFKMVTGEKNGSFQVIMLETSDRFFVLDSAFRKTFETNDAEVVSRPEQLQLLSAYSDLQYRVGFHQIANGQRTQFRINRDHFNLLEFNKEIEFTIHRKITDSLNQLNIK